VSVAAQEIWGAARQLAAAGIESAHVDAELLTAHVLGVERSQLLLAPSLDAAQLTRLGELVAERARRVPLQHLTGEAPFRRLTLAVGPGVFVPRPETELLVEWGLERLAGLPAPRVVDLCAGSGAIALSLAHEVPGAQVHAVELDPLALAWLERNAEARALAGDTRTRILRADAGAPATLKELDSTVELVLSNPPYIPLGSHVAPEAAEHDPELALWGGVDGLEVARRVVRRAAALVRPGGAFGFEHGEQQASAAEALLIDAGFVEVRGVKDLTGRPRFTTGWRP
jgi:release factor glutamine methyltransferase